MAVRIGEISTVHVAMFLNGIDVGGAAVLGGRLYSRGAARNSVTCESQQF